MKNKSLIIILIMAVILVITACQSKESDTLTIPEGYEVDKTLYMAEGSGIYVFVENEAMNYEAIGAKICNGNAKEVMEEYEANGKTEDSPEKYVAILNVLGITEVYLGDYKQAYQYFNNAIDFVNENKLPEQNKILTILYNNAGAVTLNLPKLTTENEQLQKAAKLCENPYLALVIAVNQTARVKANAPAKEYGEAIAREKKLIEKEVLIEDSPKYVLFLAAKNIGVAYMTTGQENEAIKVLDQFIPLVPEGPEYNLIMASLLGQRGHCYYRLSEYEKSIEDLQSAIAFGENSVGEDSRRLSYNYQRLAYSYGDSGDWETALFYLEKAIPGYKQAAAYDNTNLYYNLGYTCWELKKYEKAKEYFIRSYADKSALGEAHIEVVEAYLLEVYESEKNFTISFNKWLEDELKKMVSEDEKQDKLDEENK